MSRPQAQPLPGSRGTRMPEVTRLPTSPTGPDGLDGDSGLRRRQCRPAALTRLPDRPGTRRLGGSDRHGHRDPMAVRPPTRRPSPRALQRLTPQRWSALAPPPCPRRQPRNGSRGIPEGRRFSGPPRRRGPRSRQHTRTPRPEFGGIAGCPSGSPEQFAQGLPLGVPDTRGPYKRESRSRASRTRWRRSAAFTKVVGTACWVRVRPGMGVVRCSTATAPEPAPRSCRWWTTSGPGRLVRPGADDRTGTPGALPCRTRKQSPARPAHRLRGRPSPVVNGRGRRGWRRGRWRGAGWRGAWRAARPCRRCR